MADAEPQQISQNALAQTFPNPPPFWRDFTPENVSKYEELRKQRRAVGGGRAADNERIENLPDALRNLQPPLEPSDGRWRVFGDQYTLDDKLPTLEEQNIERLVAKGADESNNGKDDKHMDRAFELKRLAKSLLLNFLELTGLLSLAPDQGTLKIEDIRTLLINFHHILNEYRPHQARESAIAMMQSHLDRTRAETAAIKAQVDKAKRVLEGLGSIEVPANLQNLADNAQDGEVHDKDRKVAGTSREQEVWGSSDLRFG